MTKLLKYEIRKTWIAKMIVLGITAAAEAAFLIGMLLAETKAGDYLTSISVPILVLTAIFGVMAIGIQSLLTLHHDMNTKQGYMLYMTPKNSFQILGAKMLENGASLLLSGIFFFVLGFADITLMFARYGQIGQLWETINDFISRFRLEFEISPRGIGAFIFAALAAWLATVSIAYLADIISAALLNGKKFNGLLTFALFIAIDVGLNFIFKALPKSSSVMQGMILAGLVSIAFSVLMYILSAFIMDRYLSV